MHLSKPSNIPRRILKAIYLNSSPKLDMHRLNICWPIQAQEYLISLLQDKEEREVTQWQQLT